MKTTVHANAAIAAIKAIEKFKLTPPERMSVLKTASTIVENEITASILTLALNKALNGD